MKNILTIDVEDWYHLLVDEVPQWDSYAPRVETATRRILDLLSGQGVCATWFILGYVADRCPGLVRDIAERGHELATHGHTHQFLYRMTPEEFRADLIRSVDAIGGPSGRRVRGHRASSFTLNEKTRWALDVLEDEGFEYDSSVSPTKNFLYGWPAAPRYPHRVEGARLVEFPASTLEILGYRLPVAGGFSLRLFPYGWTRSAIRKINRAGHPAVVYVHPWEVDLEQPRLKLSAAWTFLRYHRLASTEANLRRLLEDFEFCPMGEFVDDYRNRDVGGPNMEGRET